VGGVEVLVDAVIVQVTGPSAWINWLPGWSIPQGRRRIMSSAPRRTVPPKEELELNNGDHMTQAEFHRIYEQMPPGFKAELIGGIVYVASPLKLGHGTTHPALTTLYFAYAGHTPGVQTGDNTTILLGEDGEPQPDIFLRILPEYGGQSRTSRKDYVKGPPELLTEVADSSRSIDLHSKRRDYQRYGVLEYLVLCLRERLLRWFDLRNDRELHVGADGLVRVYTFPGLWIDVEAVLTLDYQRLMAGLQLGLATAEHAAFVHRLAAAHAAQAPHPSRKRSQRRPSNGRRPSE
jgi:Uma2 family endonuclease